MDNRTEKRRDDIISHLAKPLGNSNYLFIKAIAIVLLGFISNKLCAQVPLFANNNLNVVYTCMENPISLYYSESFDTVTTTNGSVRKVKEGHYLWVPKKYGKSCLVLRAANGDSLAAAYFRVIRIPKPTPLLGGVIRSGLVELDIFKAQKGIGASVINFDYANGMVIVLGFNIIYEPLEEEHKTYYNKGAKFDDKALELIKAAKSGDVYAFENIQCRDVDGTLLDLHDVVIIIK